jgi:hypothetical protein
MVGGVFDHYLFNLVYPHMAVLFWLYLAMGVRASQMAQQLTARSAADVIGGRVFEAGELARV